MFRTILFALLIGFQFFSLHAQKLSSNLEEGYKSIQPMDPYNYCKKLASEEFAGRYTGHEGYTKCANWVASKFEEWGIKKVDPEYGYLLPFDSPYTQINSSEMMFYLPSGDTLKPELGVDYFPLIFSDKGSHTAEAVFAGWGISAPELGYDDYAGIDAKGKFVFCFRGQPDKNDTSFIKHDHHRFRMQTAKNKGALGLIYIYPIVQANNNGDWLENFMPCVINEKSADRILEEKNISAAGLKKQLLDTKQPNSFDLNTKVFFEVDSEHFPDAVGYNVVGYIEGSDPELKNECVVIGGHLDHCGIHAGLFFAGANDNASGSAVVMEIAEAYSRLKIKPKRSVVFALFGGEEKGLEGSYILVKDFPKQFTKIDAMFNHDMNGEGDGTNYGYSLEPADFKDYLLNADKNVGTLRNSFEIKNVGVRSSDFAPFFLKGAAVASFFSNGPHLHYHETGDTIYRINPDILADIAKISFIASYRWADR